jgi:hypothetical protein
MSKIQAIRDQISHARDLRKSKKSRLEALQEADALRKASKMSWSKIEEGFDIEAEAKAIADFKVKDRPAAKPKEGICHYIRTQLTTTTKDYGVIKAEVLERWPNALTTHKSIASLARDLRREGIEVASRRPEPKSKDTPLEPEAADLEGDEVDTTEEVEVSVQPPVQEGDQAAA